MQRGPVLNNLSLLYLFDFSMTYSNAITFLFFPPIEHGNEGHTSELYIIHPSERVHIIIITCHRPAERHTIKVV